MVRSAVILVVKNEVHDIAEWIAYHAFIGFDTQIILDDGSIDGTPEVIAAAGRIMDVRLIKMASQGSPESQRLAYDYVLDRFMTEFDWMFFTDSDEFLVFRRKETRVNEFLQNFVAWDAIGINWAVFGSNGHDAMPGGLITEDFTRRADASFFPNRHIKPMVRPISAKACLNPHYIALNEAARTGYCDPQGRPIAWFHPPGEQPVLGLTAREACYDVCQINHYFTRSRAHWRAKLARGYPGGHVVRTQQDFVDHDRNEIEDLSAFRYREAVRELVEQIRQAVLF